MKAKISILKLAAKTLILFWLVTLQGCTVLRPYPYPDKSITKFPSLPLEEQKPAIKTAASPLANICHLKTGRRNFKKLWIAESYYHGSGVLIDGRYIITAAHNVFDYPANNLTSIEISCGHPIVSEDTETISLNREDIKSRIHIPRYAYRIVQRARKYEFDYAFIDIGKVISEENQFKLVDEPRLKTTDLLYLAGFPGGSYSNTGNAMHLGSAKVHDINNNIVSYSLLTATGNVSFPISETLLN